MADVKLIKIEDGATSVDKIDAQGFKEIEIRMPVSIADLHAYSVKCDKDAIVRVFYSGTVSDWKKIKKGTLEEITIKHDWYGYYYHNEPYETTFKTSYLNWIGSENVTIICFDGTIQDDIEQNKSNPYHVSSFSHWD